MLILVLIALALASAGTWWLSRPDARFATVDVPNERSLHAAPIPSGGGLAMLAALLVTLLVAAVWGVLVWQVAVIVGGMLAVAAVSYVDDRRGLGVLPRLGTHLLVSFAVVLLAGLVPDAVTLPGILVGLSPFLALPLAVLGCVWMTNLFNFMDGMDGFAGGMAVVGFSTLAVLAGGSHPALSVVAMLTAAGAAGFLLFNFPPARIFMGDVGSSSLGFLAAILILWGDVSGAFPWWLGCLAFAVFIMDSTVTLGRRALRRERFWQAHRTHFYQRLVTLGWTHRRTVLMYYCVMFATTILAIAAERAGVVGQWLCLGFALLIIGVHMIVVTAWERRARDKSAKTA